MIAREWLDFTQRYHLDEVARERVFDVTAAVYAVQSVGEQSWRLRVLCHGCPALAERYLPPAIHELEDALARDPGDESAAKALEALQETLREARGDHDDEDERTDEEQESSWTPPPEFAARMADVHRLWRMGWPYEDVIAALDELAAMPFDDPGTQRAIAWERFAMVSVYDERDDEIEQVIQRTAPVLADVPVKHRASSISAACSGRPTLAEKYVPALIAELEEELRRSPDAEGEQVLVGIKRNLERTRAGG
jgi:hypothetical protein